MATSTSKRARLRELSSSHLDCVFGGEDEYYDGGGTESYDTSGSETSSDAGAGYDQSYSSSSNDAYGSEFSNDAYSNASYNDASYNEPSYNDASYSNAAYGSEFGGQGTTNDASVNAMYGDANASEMGTNNEGPTGTVSPDAQLPDPPDVPGTFDPNAPTGPTENTNNPLVASADGMITGELGGALGGAAGGTTRGLSMGGADGSDAAWANAGTALSSGTEAPNAGDWFNTASTSTNGGGDGDARAIGENVGSVLENAQPQQDDPRAMGENVGSVLDNAQQRHDDPRAMGENVGSVLDHAQQHHDDPRAMGENVGSVLDRAQQHHDDARASGENVGSVLDRFGMDVTAAAGGAGAGAGVREMANELAERTGINRADLRTQEGRVRIDLNGKPHQGIETPHVQEYEKHVAPNGRSDFRPVETRPATPADIRTAERAIELGINNQGRPDGPGAGGRGSANAERPVNPLVEPIGERMPQPRGGFDELVARESSIPEAAKPSVAANVESAAANQVERSTANAAVRAEATAALEAAASRGILSRAASFVASAPVAAAVDLFTNSTQAGAATRDDFGRINADARRFEDAGLSRDDAFRAANYAYNNGGMPQGPEARMLANWRNEAVDRGLDRSQADLEAYSKLRDYRAEQSALTQERMNRMTQMGQFVP